MKFHSGMVLCLLSLWLGGCGDDKPTSVTLPVTDKFADTSALAKPVRTSRFAHQKSPNWLIIGSKCKQALQADPPVLLLNEKEFPDPTAQLAQKLAVANPEFLKFTRDDKTSEPLRNEIMTVRKALPADFNGNAGPCAQAECWRVEMYDHFHNASTIAFVDVGKQQVLGVSRQNYAQPDLSPRLVDLASAIAGAAPEVQAILQDRNRQPDKKDFKTALQDSMCERSHHLCVAPTYVFENDALWAIVDLTDGKLVGYTLDRFGQPVARKRW